MTLRAWINIWLSLWLCALAWQVQGSDAPKIISSDWAIVETLTAMGHAPIGVGDKAAYQRWVGEPKLPSSAQDIGLRAQPNLELIRQLRPDLVVNSSWFMQLQARAIPHARTVTVDFFTDKGIEWAHTVAQTRELGRLIGKPQAANLLIEQTRVQLQRQRQQLQVHVVRPYAVVQFIDARHVRIYGTNSLYGQTLLQLGLKNAWTQPTNQWGFSQIGLTRLADLPTNTRLVVVQPYPANLMQQLNKSVLWQRLPYKRPVNQAVLPAVWSFGALPSMRRFADHLSAALSGEEHHSW